MEKAKAEINKKKETPMDQAFKVSDQIELESVRLMKCNCEQLCLVGPGPKAFEIERNASSQMNKETNRVFVTAQFKLVMFESDADRSKPFAIIGASFLLVYNAISLEKTTDEAVILFGETNGIFNAWPYWREYVQSTTTRMSLPPLTIPVFRIFPPQKAELAQEKSPKTAIKKLKD
ncbi:MAG: hypothetical protein JXB18_11605 [Sedimentisphaerales bacterium]|nr:hypothetical protein [Sedimentisphaerales bacterium]